MSNSDEIVPSLSGDPGEKTPAESPKAKFAKAALAKKAPTLQERADSQPLPAKPASPYASWRVLESQEVFRGASSFLVHREQVLSEQHFDIPGLLRLGVKLERLPD